MVSLGDGSTRAPSGRNPSHEGIDTMKHPLRSVRRKAAILGLAAASIVSVAGPVGAAHADTSPAPKPPVKVAAQQAPKTSYTTCAASGIRW